MSENNQVVNLPIDWEIRSIDAVASVMTLVIWSRAAEASSVAAEESIASFAACSMRFPSS